MLTTLCCFLLAAFAWMTAVAEWPDTPGATALLALLAGVAVVMGVLPLVQAVVPIH
jgi:hypothetical protein